MTSTVFQALGSLALFLLAMEMMTNGLKSAAGHQLRYMLGAWTKTPVKAFGAGVLITGVVQSSSAVTVATIGFVNAGLLNLSQSLGVVFGANVGTTMTGWLVSLVGFGLKVEVFAMPLLTIGMSLKLLGRGHRPKALGETLAGFALFFLALALLKESLGALTNGFRAEELLGPNVGLPMFALFGFLATVMTQSSSAALAMILSAAAGGILTLDHAAAAVIGANLGTTSTAAIAVIGATAGAKRLALGHVLFNLVTGLIALAILPVMLWLVATLTNWLELGTNAAVSLALFHTLFNLLGAALMLPQAPRLARLLGRRFRGEEEDNAEPRYLDKTLVRTPELAIAAVDQEMKRLIEFVRGLLRVCVDRQDLSPAQIAAKAEAAERLNEAINDYISQLRAERMQANTVAALTQSIRTCRYLTEAVTLAPALLRLRAALHHKQLPPRKANLEPFLTSLRTLVATPQTTPEVALLTGVEYQQLKSDLLESIVTGQIPTSQGAQALDDLSSVRRLADQWRKVLSWQSTVDMAVTSS